mgnify:CR=1 FL=1
MSRKAATVVPTILLRGPPEAQNTIARQRAPNERPFRTQCKGDPQLQPARNGGWGGRDLRSSTVRKHGQRLQPRSAPTLDAPRRDRARPPIQTKPKIILNCSYLRALTCAANMSDCAGEHTGQCIAQKGRSGLAYNRAASQAGGRAYRIMLQRSRPRRRGRKRARKASHKR